MKAQSLCSKVVCAHSVELYGSTTAVATWTKSQLEQTNQLIHIRVKSFKDHLRSWVDAELKFRLLAIVDRQPLHQKRSEAGPGAATEGVEDQEALEAGAVVRQLPDPVQHQVDDLLAHGVVPPGVVVRSVLLPGDQLLGVEQLTVCAGPDDFSSHGFCIF